MLNGKMFLQKKVSGGGLPSAFQEVEWIASNGTNGNYIDTNIEGNSGFHVKFKSMLDSSDGYKTDNVMCGTCLRYNGNYYRQQLIIKTNTTTDKFEVYNQYTSITSVINYNTDFIAEYKTFSGNAWCDIDGNRKWSYSVSYSDSSSITLPLFCSKGNGTTSQDNKSGFFRGRLYYAQFFDKLDNLIASFVPCYRKSDNKIGVYDIIGQNFCESSGTFTKGADVN